MAKDIVNELDLEDEEIITLVNDDGEEKDFLHIGTLEYEKEWYVFLQDRDQAEACADDDEHECEVYIYRIEGDEDNETLMPVEDDALAEKVYTEFLKLMLDDEE